MSADTLYGYISHDSPPADPPPRGSRPDLSPRPPLDRGPVLGQSSARKIALILSALLAALLGGFALASHEPLFVIGLTGAVFIAIAIFTKPFIGLLLYTTIFLIRPGELYPALGALHLERVVGAAALVSLLLEQWQRRHRLSIDGSRQTSLFLLFILAVLLSVPFSVWRVAALQGFLDVLKVAVFYLLVVHLVDTPKRLKIFLWVFAGLITYIAGSSFYDYLRGSAHFAQGIDRVIGETSAAGDPNSLGTTLAAAIPLFIVLALYKPWRRARWVFALATVLLISTLAVTGSRASVLGFAGGMALLWATSKHRAAAGILGAALLAFAIYTLPEQYKTRYASIGEAELDASSRARLSAWRAGINMVLDRPLCGVGIACFSIAHASGYAPDGRASWLKPHSVYVQVFAEVGVLGGGLFLMFLLEMLRSQWRGRQHLVRAGPDWQLEARVVQALLAGIVVLLISGLFGHMLLRRTWYIYAGLSLAVLRQWRHAQTAAR